ncbi:uncharacterized protein PITG_13454 [Phytophthora infestans T30-4]|uniref:Uncharacterized protein n=1 Tax=Phytophthora infestans (strain T30-4) TaxID=403677 RepID=D0NM17_PHYIT|nr:uncharacterized protein PITG_13454 [Phytophthora infestans T30-4]EEY60738.1 conserved hypothetical protein [Phytophthora infestans T30-4]|eukprot:XP_002899684.1 conserved hypothetical protein [Phytophthora infestans T30-4]
MQGCFAAENVIAPLSYASYRLQRDENTVGDVERWRQCEQPLFMLGFALHPAYADYARALPTTKVSGLGRLPSIAVYYYRRIFSTEDVGVIRSDMLDWMEGKFTRTKASEFKSSPWKYWRWVGQQRPDSMLPKLAMAVLSIAHCATA